MSGQHARAAELLASLAAAQPGQTDLARKALSEAVGAGQMDLAVRLASGIPPAKLSGDVRLLLVGDQIRRGHPERAIPWLSSSPGAGDLTFLTPLINAWSAADGGRVDQAIAIIDQVPSGSLLSPLLPEQRAFLLLKARRTADAEPLARQVVGNAGGREQQLRLAFADAFLAAGDRSRALMIIEGMGEGEIAARRRVMSGRTGGFAVDNLAKAYSEVLVAFSADLMRVQRSAPPVGIVQIARYVDPHNTGTTVLLALLLSGQKRQSEALALLRTVPASDPLIGQVRDAQVRILTDGKQLNEAYQVAASAAAARDPAPADFSRLGDVLQAMKRSALAADTYARAISLAQAQNQKGELWPLMLLRANALEDANRWPEARQTLQQALAIAPDQPLLLNFMGYGQLERGENIESAEAMIRKASELAPDDASIADSLGWAEFKRGKVDEAISTLQRAAEKDPDQAEIQEHLGDALYRSGRRYEARFAWNAALVTAEDEIAARVKAKLATGLTQSNAAP